MTGGAPANRPGPRIASPVKGASSRSRRSDDAVDVAADGGDADGHALAAGKGPSLCCGPKELPAGAEYPRRPEILCILLAAACQSQPGASLLGSASATNCDSSKKLANRTVLFRSTHVTVPCQVALRRKCT